MRKHLFLFLYCMVATLNYIFSQEDSLATNQTAAPAMRIFPGECPRWNYHPGQPNNKVENPLFSGATITAPLDPFRAAPGGVPDIPFWEATHGSPQVDIFGGPTGPGGPFPTGSRVASMWTQAPGGVPIGEGIIGLLGGWNSAEHGVAAGDQYLLTFFRDVANGGANQVDRINIYLVKCVDIPAVVRGNPNITTAPTPPAGSQQIYCETNVTPSGVGLQQVTITFTANDDYDLIWIFPTQVTTRGQAWLRFAMPHMLRLTIGGAPFNVDGAVCTDTNGDRWLGLGQRIFGGHHRWYSGTTTGSPLVANYYNDGVMYDNHSTWGGFGLPQPFMFGPITPTYTQPYLYELAFQNTIVTNNTCSTPFTGTLVAPTHWVLRQAAGGNTGTQPKPGVEIKLLSYSSPSVRFSTTAIRENTFDIYVYDQVGRLVAPVIRKKIAQGISTHDLNLPATSKGVHIIKFVAGTETYSQKIVL